MAKHSLKKQTSRWDNNEFRRKLRTVFNNDLVNFDIDNVYWEDIELFAETVCWRPDFNWINFNQVCTDWDYIMTFSWYVEFMRGNRVEVFLWSLSPFAWEQCDSIDEIIDDIIHILCKKERIEEDIEALKSAVNFSYIN